MWCYGESRCMHGKESHNCWESRSPFVFWNILFWFRRASLHEFPSINFGNSSVSVSGGGWKGNALTEGCLLFFTVRHPRCTSAQVCIQARFWQTGYRFTSIFIFALRPFPPFPECTMYESTLTWQKHLGRRTEIYPVLYCTHKILSCSEVFCTV